MTMKQSKSKTLIAGAYLRVRKNACVYNLTLQVQQNLSLAATQNRQKTILMTNGSLMKVESIAECSLWSILQYF